MVSLLVARAGVKAIARRHDKMGKRRNKRMGDQGRTGLRRWRWGGGHGGGAMGTQMKRDMKEGKIVPWYVYGRER